MFRAALLLGAMAPLPCAAQVTPAAGYTPPDDSPSVKIGATLFTDYTVVDNPKIKDADGNEVTANAFNVGRAYINITGNISHLVAFRITPDVTRETGGSSLNGSYTFRLKYAYAQINLDDWINPGRTGTWTRLGMQQTPWVDFLEGIYRYRFQGTIFEEREGFLSSSDVGASFHTTLPGNYGDIHGGVYNGETYSRSEVNDQKGFMVRGTVRPLRMHPVLRGLRLSGFYDKDAYLRNAERKRAIAAVTFEHKYLNAAFQYLDTRDQTSATKTPVDARGYSVWATPRTTNGWEGLVRFDHLEPNRTASGTRDRVIGGIAYWFPHQGTVSGALLLDVDQATFHDFTAAQPTQTRIGLHALVNF
ncbi:MAG: hypothetical protein V7647_1678 [Acidobacteriota bacterium]|jgi:hypothetical protein